MTITTATADATASRWADPVAIDGLDGGYSGRITAARARSTIGAGELVSVESEHLGNLLLTPEQAAELAEVLDRVSGMACGPRHAPFLADAVRDSMARKGCSVRSVSAATGISRHRLNLLLSGKRAMTNEELKAISNSGPA